MPSPTFGKGYSTGSSQHRHNCPGDYDCCTSRDIAHAALQRRYFDEYAAGLRADHPEWAAEQVHSMASRYVSPPGVAPHSAGAAVDLTLADADGRELDLGTRMNATPEESAGACYTRAEHISDGARSHRAVLSTALTAASTWSTTPRSGGTGRTETATGLSVPERQPRTTGRWNSRDRWVD